MGFSARLSVRLLVVGALALVWSRTATAFYLDEDRTIAFRGRFYSQAAVRISDSGVDTVPAVSPGDIVQHRTFLNPELEAKLTKYTEWMRNIRGLQDYVPDDFSFRAAGWGFYDGVYDYGAHQFDRQRKKINRSWAVPDQESAFFLEGDHFGCTAADRTGPAIGGNPECVSHDAAGRPTAFGELRDLFPGAEKQKPYDIYAHRERVNELYLNYTKGPFFMRLGRQAISWGEADTIGILDQNNPFDVTRGAPGAFIDLDEARIPLWTLRSSFDLLRPFNIDSIGPFSSPSIEAYWVPGFIDTNTGTLPILTASPYSPRGDDPQSLIRSLQEGGLSLPVQFVLLDRVPQRNWKNSRFGVRLQTVIARDHTFSVWYYNHFPNQPVPQALGLTRAFIDSNEDHIPQQPEVVHIFTTQTVHKLTDVYGIADTFFLEPIDSIIRTELEYFRNEPAFIPELNLGAAHDPTKPDPLGLLATVGKVPSADFLRWEVGVDRFFFLRSLNPTNSFTFASAIVGSYNINEGDQECTGTGTARTCYKRDYRYAGLRKPGRRGDLADDFVQLKPVEVFAQTHLETAYMHGRVNPSITVIVNARGTHAVLPEVNFRITDYFLMGIKAVYIGGEFQQLGFYKDRDEISMRATYLIN